VGEQGEAIGEADLSAVRVAGEVEVGLEMPRLADEIGVVAENDAWHALLSRREGVEKTLVEIDAIDAGQADDFDCGIVHLHFDSLMQENAHAPAHQARGE